MPSEMKLALCNPLRSGVEEDAQTRINKESITVELSKSISPSVKNRVLKGLR